MDATVADTITDYATAQRAAGHSPNTIRVRCSYLRRWATALASPHDPDWAATSRFLATDGWSVQTRATAACAVRSWLRWAHRRRLDVTMTVDDVDVPTIPQRSPRPLDEAVILAALAASGEATALLLLLGREAGLRRAEIARCGTGDLLPGGLLLVHGKGRKQRIVPLSPMLAEHIAAAPPGWLFPNPIRPGEPMTPAMVGYRVRKALGGHGTTHQLRHSFATANYQASGHDIRAVQELLGHSSVATTAGYVSVDADALRASVDAASLMAVPSQRHGSESGVMVSNGEGER